ncbi:DUF389 domain-containing protein [Roseibium sp.]|uniref:DUF389 domain-containing protein n=1 Tax=Roseibium sp. TaxID=1936156 RepID=UPI003B5008DC
MKRVWSTVRSRFFESKLHGELTSKGDLADRMDRTSRATVPFFLMLSLSAVLATLGLIANSTATVIGAMIVAPLMSPIMSTAFGIATFDIRLVARALVTAVLGSCCVVAVGYCGVLLVGARVVGPEILARTSPSMLDLVVALAAGCAGAYAQTRPRIADSIAGVAIAVALVPPLAVTGIGLALGDKASSALGVGMEDLGLSDGGLDIAAGGFLLFLTNFVGIVIIAGLVFIVQNYGDWKKGLATLMVMMVGSYALMPPLQTALYEIYVKNRLLRIVNKNLDLDRAMNEDHKVGRIHSVSVDYRHGRVLVSVVMTADRAELDSAQAGLDRFVAQLSRDIKQEVVIQVDIEAVDIHRFTARGDEQ